MFAKVLAWFHSSSAPSRRRTSMNRLGLEQVDALEARTLLSAAGPAPAALADGNWDFHTELFDGKIQITQTGVKAKTTFEYGIIQLSGKGVIRNENLILKFKGSIGPFGAKARIAGSLLDGGDSFSGVLKGKLPIIGKFSAPINAEKA